ncbi:MAG: hypothetical protein P8Q14_04130 [Vicingaceae bacterium]|nr:hypothetical protein [Vicingaceae bacterium]
MKKIISITLLLIAFTQTTNAQIEGGKKIIGASSNMGLNSSSPNGGGSSTSTLQLNTSWGYLFTKNLAAGLDLGFSNTSFGGTSVTTTNIGGFGRIYFKNVYPEFNIGKIITNNSFGGNNTYSYYGFGIGYAITLNDYISIDPKLSYTTVNSEYNSGSSNLGINIGFNLYF